MLTLTESDTDTSQRARRATAEYRSVFGERPDLEIVSAAGVDSIVISGWLWLYLGDDRDGRWAVRICLPDDPWFHKFECFVRRDGYTVEKPSFDDALVYLFQHEAHRRCHAAREGRVCNR